MHCFKTQLGHFKLWLKWSLIFWVSFSVQAQKEPKVLTELASEADLQFQLGNKAFENKNYEQALSHYFTSNRLAPNSNLMLNIALCYDRLGRYIEAYRYYKAYEAYAQDSKEKKALQIILKRIQKHVALVEVRSQPPGATIYINRKDLGAYGKTPRTLALAPSEYHIILEKKGYETYTSPSFKLSKGKSQEVQASLSRILGKIEIQGSPQGATIEIEDIQTKVLGQVPQTFEVTPGNRVIRISAPGFHTHEQTVALTEKGYVKIKVDLKPKTGTVIIESDEDNALISVDGKPMGFTPAVLENIPVGEHLIRVESQGFRAFEQKIKVKLDQKKMIQADLAIAEDVAAASRRQESIADAPTSVSLISKQEIEHMAYGNLADALQGTRGIYISDDGAYLSAGFRGFSPFGQYGNRLQVQIDGHIVNDDWIGSSFIGYDLMPHLYGLERIEIVRGPSSVLYGTNAFFGVIHLVTFSQVPEQWHGVWGTRSTGDGAWQTYAQASGPLGKKGGIWMSGGGFYTQGQHFHSPMRQALGQASDTDYVGASQGGGFLTHMNWEDFSIYLYFNQRDKTVNHGIYNTIFGDVRNTLFDRRAYADFRYEPYLTKNWQLFTRLAIDGYTYRGDFPYPAPVDLSRENFESHWINTEARVQYNPLSWGHMDMGLNFQYHLDGHVKVENTGQDLIAMDEDHPYYQGSGYIYGDTDLLSWLNLSAGGRLDAWAIPDLPQVDGSVEDRFFWTFNPRLALLGKWNDKHAFKWLFGRAFRAPSIYEMTYNDNGLTQVVSPNLDPETIYTSELEYRFQWTQEMNWTTSVFGNLIQNRIEQQGEGTSSSPLYYQNIDRDVWTVGFETEWQRTFYRGWMASIQYSYQHTRVGNWLDGDRLPNAPEHMGALKVMAPIYPKRLKLGSKLSVESARWRRDMEKTQSLWLWDIVLSGQAKTLDLNYALSIKNLLNWQWEMPVGEELMDPTLQMPGRSFTFDLSWTF